MKKTKYFTAKVSIIIPCYNDKDYIKEAVQSAINQTYSNTEIIIIDDGSNEATKKVLSGIKCENVELISQENKGLSAARNVGIAKATGDYILTLDADDVFEPTFVEKAVLILDKNDYIGVVSCFCNCFVDLNKVIYKHKPKGGELSDFLYTNNAMGNSLFRKSCWLQAGGFDEQMKNGYEDWEFWISVTKQGWRVYIIHEFLFNYRKKENSMLQNTNQLYEEENYRYVLNKHKNLYVKDFDKTIAFLQKPGLKYKTSEIKRLNSIDYKLGKLILSPVRYVKNLLSKKT